MRSEQTIGRFKGVRAMANPNVVVHRVDPRKRVIVWRLGTELRATVIETFNPAGQPVPTPQEREAAEALFEVPAVDPPTYPEPMAVVRL